MARIVNCYGGGGKPQPWENRRVTVSFVCEACREHVSPDDTVCKHCGEPLEGRVDDCEVDSMAHCFMRGDVKKIVLPDVYKGYPTSLCAHWKESS